jgi:predicted  nucleic acid-binding Zn-ribbon protein
MKNSAHPVRAFPDNLRKLESNIQKLQQTAEELQAQVDSMELEVQKTEEDLSNAGVLNRDRKPQPSQKASQPISRKNPKINRS